jgi:hypothetical protein
VPGIEYVGTRYEQLATLLYGWGYEIVPEPFRSRWDEIVRASPLTGLVLIRGERVTADGAKLVFEVKEIWEEGDLGSDAAAVRHGASLVNYHYHGSSPVGNVRWCLYGEGRHSEMPYHVHPFGLPPGPDTHSDLIVPDEPLVEFETLVLVHTHDVDDDEDADEVEQVA